MTMNHMMKKSLTIDDDDDDDVDHDGDDGVDDNDDPTVYLFSFWTMLTLMTSAAMVNDGKEFFQMLWFAVCRNKSMLAPKNVTLDVALRVCITLLSHPQAFGAPLWYSMCFT